MVSIANDALSAEIVDQIRRDFASVVGHTYLDIASCAPLSQTLQHAVARHLSDLDYGFDKSKGLALIEQSRSLFAQLINAQPDDIALTKNVSEGLNFIAAAIDWKAGDNVVVCPALEHPNNRYLWQNLAQRLGVELRLISAFSNEYPIDKMLSAIDAHTRLVTLSSVSYVPGFLTPLETLSAVCRRQNILLLVDGAQSVGPLHTDVQAMGIDALAVTTQKGLLGLYGMGFLYVHPDWARRLHPVSLARFGVDEGLSLSKGLSDEPLQLHPGARRFDLGNYNLVGAVAVNESLTLLNSIGTETIQTHNLSLARALSQGLSGLGLPVCRPSDQSYQTHVVSLGSVIPEPDRAEFDLLLALYQTLTASGIRASWRNGILRFSTHLYNNHADVQTVLTLTQVFLERLR